MQTLTVAIFYSNSDVLSRPQARIQLDKRLSSLRSNEDIYNQFLVLSFAT